MAYLKKEAEREDQTGGLDEESPEARVLLAEDPEKASELQIEDVVVRVLRYGSLLSMAIIVIGVALLVWHSLTTPGSTPVLFPAPGAANPDNPATLVGGLEKADPISVISLGLLVLILTPVIRVISTVVFFAVKRDLTYLAITGFVLFVLIAGFLLGSTAG